VKTVHDPERRIAAFLEEGTEVLPDWVLDGVQDQVDATPQRRPRWRAATKRNALRLGLVAAAVLVVGLGFALVTRPDFGTERRPPPSRATWSGPVRPDAAGMPILPLTKDAEMGGDGWAWADGRDAAVPWVDIGAVRWQLEGQVHWWIDLAGWPPPAEELDPDETIIEYGVVLDANGDRVADYEFGINNDAPEAGDFRVWVTDLATGDTDERVGPPYGYPVEFSHPDEHDRSETLNGHPLPPSMVFTFLPGSRPSGPPEEVGPTSEWQFYVWATVTEGGEVEAWDYTPDYGWLTVPSP
jgi:hypothetical protein